MSGIVVNNTNRGSGIVKAAVVGADAIDGSNIADDAIDSEHYTDGSIDNAHIADDAIDSEHYADGSIDNAHIADDAIDSEHYADGSIDNAHIADDAIDSEHYADGSIDEAHIADNAVTLAKMAGGTDGNIISFDASGDPVAIATGNDGQVLTSTGAGSPPAFETVSAGWTQGTEVATTSGTEHDFTGIPAGVRVVQIGFENVTLDGTSSLIVQLGTASGFEASGYSSASARVTSSASVMLSDSGLGYVIIIGSAARSFNGVMTLVNKDAAAYDWSSMHGGRYDSTAAVHGGGWTDLAAELNSIRINTINGSDTFDGGAININYL